MNINRNLRDPNFSLMPRMPPPGAAAAAASASIYTGAPVGETNPLSLAPPKLESISEHHVFSSPMRAITTEASMDGWLKSEALARFLSFITTLNGVYSGKPLSAECSVSDSVIHLLNILQMMKSWIDDIPPFPEPQRFGNRAFKTWVERLEERATDLIMPLLPCHFQGPTGAILELAPYFVSAFGHKTRLDYGSGHELSFVLFLTNLNLLGVTNPLDHPAIAFKVIPTYFELARSLQKAYTLEPAGSHGVWGLDDHQFLCYYWGAAQLVDHRRLKPKSILQREIVDAFAKDYMYLRAIQFIYEMKSGPFHEHSPMLYDISGVPNWGKVNTGMLKMYIAEVIKKFPVVQHIPFGTLLPFRPAGGLDNSHESPPVDAAK